MIWPTCSTKYKRQPCCWGSAQCVMPDQVEPVARDRSSKWDAFLTGVKFWRWIRRWVLSQTSNVLCLKVHAQESPPMNVCAKPGNRESFPAMKEYSPFQFRGDPGRAAQREVLRSVRAKPFCSQLDQHERSAGQKAWTTQFMTCVSTFLSQVPRFRGPSRSGPIA